MRVAVVLLVRRSASHLFNGNDAAFKLRAAGVLKLNGGMADSEVIV